MTKDDPAPPFPPSWVDRFTDWIETLPGPFWLAVLILYFLLSAQAHLMFWIFGSLAWGEVDPAQFVYHLFTAEVLFFYQYLDKDATRALLEFRPLLNLADEEFDDLRYQFTHQPARLVLLLTVLGIFLGTYYSYSVQLLDGGALRFSFESAYGVIGFAIPMILALIFGYRIVRQMRTVRRLYASATNLDLFNLDPVYALSAHTAKMGLIFLILTYSNLLLSPGSIEIPTALFTTIVVSLLSFAAFILPLSGINRRLVAEKKAMLLNVHLRIKQAFAHLEAGVEQMDLGGMPELEKTISSLEREKAFIEKIPTWPWQPATMRGFLSAMLLPIIVWLIQQVLDRYLSF